MRWVDPGVPLLYGAPAYYKKNQANLGHHLLVIAKNRSAFYQKNKNWQISKSRTAHCDLIITNVSHRTIFTPKFKVHIFWEVTRLFQFRLPLVGIYTDENCLYLADNYLRQGSY